MANATAPIPTSEKLLLTAAEVAGLIGVHVDDVYKMGAAGILPSLKLGPRRTRYVRKGLEAWIEKHQRTK